MYQCISEVLGNSMQYSSTLNVECYNFLLELGGMTWGEELTDLMEPNFKWEGFMILFIKHKDSIRHLN